MARSKQQRIEDEIIYGRDFEVISEDDAQLGPNFRTVTQDEIDFGRFYHPCKSQQNAVRRRGCTPTGGM